MSVPPAIAQDDAPDDSESIDLEPVPSDQVVGPFKIDDGSYTGALTQSVRVRFGGQGIEFLLSRDGSGTASFSVTDEVLVGEWSMTDSGGLSELGRPGFIEAVTVGSASGTLSGSFPYTLAGVFVSDTSATVDPGAIDGRLPVGPQSAQNADSFELSFELSESVQVCGQVQANWDESMRALYVETGAVPSIKTQLVAFPEVPEEDIQERLVDLVESATFAANEISSDEGAIVLMIDAVLTAEKLMSDIDAYPDTCPLDPEFLRVVNQVLRDMMNALLDNWTSQDEYPRALTLRKLVEVGHRAGILGSGSADPMAAQFLEDKITSVLQASFDDASLEPTDNEDELRQLIVVAEMFGYQLAEASNADLCIVLGGC